MGFEDKPISDRGSDEMFPTVEELISKLRSSFFEKEFQYAEKTLMEREHHIKQNYAKLTAKVEEEKRLLLSENQKLKDEIDAVRKLNAEYERKFRVYAKESMGSGSSSINLKNKEQKDRATESNGPPLFSEKEDSKKETEPKMHEIIEIDDDDDCGDDDDDQKCLSTLKGKRVTKEIKREYNGDDDGVDFISTSKRRRVSKEIKSEYNTDLDDDDDDSGSDTEIKKVYMSTIGRMKKQNERWESEINMVKDLEKDDDLCLNGICALHRQRVIVHGTDISTMSDLACKLIDGDSQRKLKKKASELNHFDLNQCRMFAKKYSLQLFSIYQKKSDPFFPTSRG